ncbi:MAG: hypothetical protein IKY83_06365 [Proteobacteria bacterium]|nr:hypothetical protein [Pseudomonadota bacterium]
MTKRNLLFLLALSAVLHAGCGSDAVDQTPDQTPPDSPDTPDPGTPDPGTPDTDFIPILTHKPGASVQRTFDMTSTTGCALDSDCTTGMFCFHGTCTKQCSEELPCESGTCSPNGRCIADARKSLRSEILDQNKNDILEAQKSNIVEQIPAAEVTLAPAEKIYVPLGAEHITTKLVTAKDYGPINYIVQNPMTDDTTNLLTSSPEVDEKTGRSTYTLTLPVKASSLGDQGAVERLIIDTSVGSFEVALAPQKKTTARYEGMVSADQFAGVGVPVRFIIETQPEFVTHFDEIQSITLYMPSSGNDLLSPESVTDHTETTWSKVVMSKETSNCMDADKCFAAEYSTNDFTFPSSRLLDASHKVNRSIRIEINGYDSDAMMFDGSMRDILAGIYRETGANGTMQWAKATMNGTFIVTRKSSFTPGDKAYTVKEHEKQTEKLREINQTNAYVCTAESLAALFTCPTAEPCDLSACKTITLDDFKAGKPEATTCLIKAADALIAAEDRVSLIIEKLITKEASDLKPVQGFATLQDFMDSCALEDGICKDRPEIACAVDLLGRAYLVSTEDTKLHILQNWHQLLRESYLGRQYSAWQNDTDVRRKWLENATAPSFLSATLEKLNTDRLAEWETKVFAAHLNVLKRQFNQTSLEVLTRVDANSQIVSSRDLILAEFAEGWEGVSDALSLGLRRYDTLYQGTTQRIEKAEQMRPHLFDLYYAGLVETALNKATDNGSLNASYGKSLSENVLRLKSLGQSFDDLVFMRDAEVVTSTSVDPLSGNAQVLSDRQKLAKDTVAAAQAKRDRVFDDYDQKTIDKAQINATLSNTVDTLLTELVNICGLPKGCDTAKENNCTPRTEPGYCGFDIPTDSERKGALDTILNESTIDITAKNKYYAEKNYELNAEDLLKETQLTDYYSLTSTGEAAEAILAYRAAVKDLDIAKADFLALSNKVAIAKSTCDTYASNIENWNNNRIELLSKVQENIDVINAHYDNITAAEREKLSQDINSLQQAYNQQSTYVDEWKKLSATYKDDQIADLEYAEKLAKAAMSTDYAASLIDRATESAATFFEEPTEIGKATGFVSTVGGIKGATVTAGNLIAGALEGASLGLNIAQTASEVNQAVRDINYAYNTEIASLQNDLKIAELEIEFQKALAYYQSYKNEAACKEAIKSESSAIQCHAAKVCDCSEATENLPEISSEDSCPTDKNCKVVDGWVAAGLDQWILSEQNAIDTLDEINDTMRELFEIQNAYEQDLQALDFKRDEYLIMSQDLLTKREQIIKAEIAMYAAKKHYYAVIQRAMMLKSQYDAASQRLQKINNLYSTPATIFAFASDLEIVESKIELAKERIYDYLAAVEYLSVRPFVDLRRATYLARSTNDLDAIIDQIDTVVSKCGGGKPNTASVEVSAREMMGITQDLGNITMSERFQTVIAKGNIPINSLTRYTVDTTVRDLLNKKIDLRSGTFAVTIDKSMNLATTCNAKIESIAVQLVGQDLIKEGAGSNVTPTITVFYDGQTQLASCQPNIETLVSTIGTKTSYGKYSTFIVEPTKISPTAKINEYGESNITLDGKPFATSYTVLIDTQISENAKINWDNLEDIKLKINYTYQDLFPNNSACISL